MLRDSRESPVAFTLPGGQACVLQSPASGGDGRVLILVHNPPLDDKDNPLLQHLARSLGFATVSIDLTGCGESSGATKLVSHERDADDLSACVRHCREVLGLEVAGLVGLGGGGTAALVLAARSAHPALELVVAVGAHASLQAGGAERAAGLTWSQLEKLKADGAVEGFKDSRGRARRLECAAGELSGDMMIDLSGLSRCGRTHFLVLHGSQVREHLLTLTLTLTLSLTITITLTLTLTIILTITLTLTLTLTVTLTLTPTRIRACHRQRQQLEP